jgi:hypothetical protein
MMVTRYLKGLPGRKVPVESFALMVVPSPFSDDEVRPVHVAEKVFNYDVSMRFVRFVHLVESISGVSRTEVRPRQ